MRKRLGTVILLPLLAALLAGCAGVSEPWQGWISDFLARSTATPPVDNGLQPTPTLATGSGVQPAATTQPPAATAPPEATQDAVVDEFGPFTGTFQGTMVGDNDSSAPLELQLVQRGRNIEGAATLGEGLIVRAGGVCGSFPIPAITLNASDQLDQAGERTLSTSTTVTVSGFEIPVELQAQLDADGNTVTAQATMYPPALCGANPTVTATLTRVSE